MRVAPDTIMMEPGDSMYFIALDSLSNGKSGPAAVQWSATAGTVDSAGLYRAPAQPGSYHVIATGPTSADSALVVVAPGVGPAIAAAISTSYWLEISPGSLSLPAGGSAQFTAAFKTSDGGSYGIRAVWRATGGTITATGAYTAPATAGSYLVIVNREGDSIADTALVTVGGGTAPVDTSTVGTQSYKRSGFWIEVLPSTLTLAARGAQQFTAIGRGVSGKTYGVQVNWRTTGGTITTSGYYTAPSTNGAYRVIATRVGDVQTDTTVVTVGSGTATPPPAPPTLSAVVLTPATVSLATGATQQFSATGRMSDGSTAAVSVTYAATGGTITPGGLYTAGATAGAYRVIAVQQGGTRADTSGVTVTTSAPPPPPPPANGTADPAALPAAVVGSPLAPQVSAYTALNVPGMTAGQSYVDPATGTRVVKLTDATWGTGQLGPDYAHHGRVGRNSGTRYPFLVYNPGGSRSWTVGEFDLATLRSTKKFTWTGGTQIRNELCAAFSSTQPMILYGYGSGNLLHKYDVSGSTPVELTGGGFPKSFAGHAHGESNNAWFAVSADDRWFLIMMGQGGPWVVVWDSQTDTFYETSESGLDQPGLDPNGRYVFFKGTERVWDPVTGTKTAMSVDLLSPTHMSVTRGYAFGGESNAPDNSRWYRVNLATGAVQFATQRFLHASQNNAGGWMDQPSDGTEWVLQNNTAGGGAGASLNRAIGVFRLDGSSFRTLVNTYNNGDGSYYGDYSWPSFSPDGRVVYYKSDMNGSGHQDAFMALLPTR